ncbi:MAG: glutamate 5-kinase [Deltaproteobacteria bacterium]|nr:glutamate 5-kinase [Deltaproteobacteria bacterium]MBW2393841.1 glutamate 5-kinase [Deltaproteobacteria bacterium]
MTERKIALEAKRIVVKVGTGVLTDGGAVRPRVMGSIARQVADLMDEGREIVLVSSGAIALGARSLGWSHPGRSIPEKQAAAAVGQIGLAELWRRRLDRHGRRVGQVLVTRTGLEDRERFLNARHTLTTLLGLGAVPVVNENDTVATEEIRFGDNDNLSATVVNLVGADLLVILTDVDGLYEHPPVPGEPKPALVPLVEKIDARVKEAAGGSESAFGRGGMITKLEAVRSASRSGAATVLCNGRKAGVLSRVAAGENVGTLFLAGSRLAGRKHWLAYTARPLGRVELDAGAVVALRERGRSLLAAGIAKVDGRFGIGDPISCIDPAGNEFARGLAAYGADEIERIKGRKTSEINLLLGYSNGDEVIHRDDLVLLD